MAVTHKAENPMLSICKESRALVYCPYKCKMAQHCHRASNPTSTYTIKTERDLVGKQVLSMLKNPGSGGCGRAHL